MSDEDAFLAAVAADPSATLPRLAYADWLDDHGRPGEAELLRVGELLAAGTGTPNDRDWFRALAAARDPAWLARVLRPEVGRCGLRFAYACPKRWADMTPTTDPAERHCDGCQKRVYLCHTHAEASNRVGWGDCVAVDPRLVDPASLRPGVLTESVVSGLVDFDYRPPRLLPRPEPPPVGLRLAALVPAWGLVDLARAEWTFGYAQSLSRLPGWFAGDGPPGDDADPFWRAVTRLAADGVDLPARTLDLGERFDLVHWLLSATRRGEPGGPADAAVDRLFGTGSPLANHVRSASGRPVVVAPPAVTRAAADALAGLGPTAAGRFVPGRLGGVYGCVAGRDDAGERAAAVGLCERLTAFVAAADGRGDGLIVVMG